MHIYCVNCDTAMPVRLTVAVAEDIGLYMVLAVCVTRWLFNERQPISTFPLSLCERPVSLRPHIDKQLETSVGEDIVFGLSAAFVSCPGRYCYHDDRPEQS